MIILLRIDRTDAKLKYFEVVLRSYRTLQCLSSIHIRTNQTLSEMPVPTINLTQENFEETINNNDIVILDFWAEWCGPCKLFGPIFEEASARHPDVVFAKVDTEQEQELAGYFQVRSIPMVVAFREQIGVSQNPGLLQCPQLDAVLV